MFLRLKNLMNKLHVYPNNNLSKRFLIDKAIYNSLADLPSKGSCFGVIGNAPISISDSFSIPAYSRFAFINTGDSTDGALLAIDSNGNIYSAYRNNGIWNTGQVSASKSDLASTDITPKPISGLTFAPTTMFKKAGIAYLNLQISNTTSAAISMENGKVIATGFPIPYKKQQVYVEAIPWNNGATGSNASTTPLRLCINNTGQLCSYYPSANEKITPGMPICINMAYPIHE